MAARQTVAAWLAANISLGAPAECWNASGRCHNKRGWHVTFKAEGSRHLAHRAAWEAAHGPIPSGLCVLHRCDNPRCCNPSHLFLGTQGDNARDMWAKGRARVFGVKGINRGPSPTRTLLASEVESVFDMYASGKTQEAIAQQFGISDTAIGFLLRGLTYPELTIERRASISHLLGRGTRKKAQGRLSSSPDVERTRAMYQRMTFHVERSVELADG